MYGGGNTSTVFSADVRQAIGGFFENVMKVHECMEISRPVLEAMRRAGVRLDDVRYLDMYKRFLSMKRDCLKVTYIAEKLSEEYNIKPRQFYYIVKKWSPL